MAESVGPNLGRQATIFAVILLVSLGLCGYTNLGGAAASENYAVGALGLLGLAVGGIGLLVTGIRSLRSRS